MNDVDLAETIKSEMSQHGFARLEAAQVYKVFSASEEAALQDFARNNGWDFSRPDAAQSGEFVFYSTTGASPAEQNQEPNPEGQPTKPLNQQSPSEKLKEPGAPHVPAPGVERTGLRAVKNEFNPNTE